MKYINHIKAGFFSRMIYWVFIILLSVPVTGYVYNFQEFTVSSQVECYFKPNTATGHRCCHFSAVKFQQVKEAAFARIARESAYYSLCIITGKINVALAQQTDQYLSIEKIRLFPSNKYRNDVDDDELRSL